MAPVTPVTPVTSHACHTRHAPREAVTSVVTSEIPFRGYLHVTPVTRGLSCHSETVEVGKSEADVVSSDVATPDLLYKGQAYWLVGHKAYTRQDGSESTLDVYRSHCAKCGCSFLLQKLASNPWPNRRCEKHRKPGKRV